MAAAEEPQQKRVFVIMPFTKTPSRTGSQLTVFFEKHIKAPIEAAALAHRYQVHRSADTFNITEQIVRDLYRADVAICDLSGPEANPNVMYELGMRLAFSNSPVILIREVHQDNKQLFDIGGFYAHPYDPYDYSALTQYLLDKLKKLESGVETYESPVLKIARDEEPLLRRLSTAQAVRLLVSMSSSLQGVARLFAGVVYQHVAQQNPKIQLSVKADEFLESLEANAKALNKLSWDGLAFRFGSQPAVDYYIATRYLGGLVHPAVEERFAEAVVEYHAHFLAGDSLWTRWSIGTAHQFFGETALLRLMAGAVAMLLREPENASKHEKAFVAFYERRNMNR